MYMPRYLKHHTTKNLDPTFDSQWRRLNFDKTKKMLKGLFCSRKLKVRVRE